MVAVKATYVNLPPFPPPGAHAPVPTVTKSGPGER